MNLGAAFLFFSVVLRGFCPLDGCICHTEKGKASPVVIVITLHYFVIYFYFPRSDLHRGDDYLHSFFLHNPTKKKKEKKISFSLRFFFLSFSNVLFFVVIVTFRRSPKLLF